MGTRPTRARVLAIAAAVVLLPALPGRPARACSCTAELTRVADAYADASAVFVGRVERVVRVSKGVAPSGEGAESLPAPDFDGVLATLAVVEAYKGVDASQLLVGARDEGCFTFRFAEGETYLFYADRDADEALPMVPGCTRSRRAAVAAGDLEYLRGLPATREETRLSGTVLWSEELGAWDRGRPLADVRVTLEGNGRALETVTDAGGVYRFAKIAPGQYTVAVHLPEHLTAVNAARPVTVGKAWEVLDIFAWLAGRIRGRLVGPDGKPFADVKVAAVPADAAPDSEEYDSPIDAYTEEDGTFVVTGLTPGRYVLVANPSGRADSDAPFPRTFVPGVASRADATVIAVEAGAEASLRDFGLPRALEQVVVEGVVVDKAGKPWPKAWVRIEEIVPEREPAAGPDPSAWIGTTEADAAGRFSFRVLAGRAYEVDAILHMEGGRDEVTPDVRVRARKGAPAVRLVAPVVRKPS
jgi:hypothetical protein